MPEKAKWLLQSNLVVQWRFKILAIATFLAIMILLQLDELHFNTFPNTFVNNLKKFVLFSQDSNFTNKSIKSHLKFPPQIDFNLTHQNPDTKTPNFTPQNPANLTKTCISSELEANYSSNLLAKWLAPGGEPCKHSRTVDITVPNLDDLGLDEEAIAKTLVRCPEIFATSIDTTLEKKLKFLSYIGVSKTHIPRVIRKYPELFVCDVDRALLPRMRYFTKIGLSRKDVGFMVRRFSPLLGYSVEEVLRPKLEFLVNTMGRPVSHVVEYPRYFSYSLKKKIKPRYWILKSRNIEFTLKEMLGKNDEEFADVYLGVGLGEVVVPPS